MDSKEIWNEICFLLDESIKQDISEKDYENQVIRAIEKLGWREFTGEIKRQPVFKIGRNNTIRPDIAIYKENDEPLVMIEIKRPSEQISKEEPANQLISYILQAQTDFGILIGSSIRLYYHGKDNPQRQPILLDRIDFNKDSDEGIRFVSIFNRSDFLRSAYKTHITELVNKFTAGRNIKILKEEIVKEDTKEKILEFLKSEYSEYGPDVIDVALGDLEIELSFAGGHDPDPGDPTLPDSDIQTEGVLKTVFEMIKSNPGGITKSKLLQITGFQDRQISNAVYKLNKRGEIDSDGRGTYKASSSIIPQRKKEKFDSEPIKPKTISKGTIIDIVYDEIKKIKDGCSKDHLKEALELEPRQLSNVLFKLSKRGLIESVGRGIYIAT